MSEVNDILHQHNLKRTGCREGILSLLVEADTALSEIEIKDALGSTFDRTTFYRSFKTLIDAGIIHKIVVDSQRVVYAINSDTYQNRSSHMHFYCNECDKVVCIDQPGVRVVELPGGYTSKETEVLVKGRCCNCNAESRRREKE